MYRLKKCQNATLGLLVWIALLTNGAAAAYLAKDAEFNHPRQVNAEVGNQNAGSDIYGIGVRVGFYLQGIAFTMNAFTSETRKGILLPTISVQAAILVSLSVLLARDSISLAEVLIILDILSFTMLPTMLAVVSIDSAGQGLGISLFVISILWTQILNTWFWAKGYLTITLARHFQCCLFLYASFNRWMVSNFQSRLRMYRLGHRNQLYLPRSVPFETILWLFRRRGQRV